jgi:mevalonate pyrophosphate decarboxylase
MSVGLTPGVDLLPRGRLFREQRATRLEDARRATYVAYLRELENHFFLGGTPEKARALQAAVLLVSSPAVRAAATRAVAAANSSDLARYTRAHDDFIEAAQRELTAEP